MNSKILFAAFILTVSLSACSGRQSSPAPSAEKEPLLHMFYAEDTLFTDTGRIVLPSREAESRSFTVIIENVRVPSANGQANFGSRKDGYLSLGEGAMAVKFGDGYTLFLAEDTVEYEGRFFKKSALSEDTLTWLKLYNSLPAEDRAVINYVPFELWPETAPGEAKETDSPS